MAQQQPTTWTTTESGGGQVVMQPQPVYISTQPQQPVYVQQTGGYYYGVHPCCNTPYYSGLDSRERCKRLTAFILGIFAAFFLLIALAENEMNEGDYGVTCGWTEVYGNRYYYYSALPFSEACDNDLDGACTAQAGGIISLLLLLSAMIVCVLAVVFVNPFCLVRQSCGPIFGKLFITTLVLIVVGIIVWFALCSGFCMDYLDLGIGTSLVLSIIAAILVAVAVGVLYSKRDCCRA